MCKVGGLVRQSLRLFLSDFKPMVGIGLLLAVKQVFIGCLFVCSRYQLLLTG